MTITKPVAGQDPWDVTLNAALDALDAVGTTNTADIATNAAAIALAETAAHASATYVADLSGYDLNLQGAAVAGTDITSKVAAAITSLTAAGGAARFSSAGVYNINGAALSGAAASTSWLAQILYPAIVENSDGVFFKIKGLQTPVFGAYSGYGKGVVLLGNAGLASVGALSSPLSTSGAITTLPVSATSKALGVAQRVLLDDGAGHQQVWTLTAAAAAGATSLTVASQVPTFAFPATTTTVSASVAMFAVQAPGTGVNAPNSSQILTAFEDLTIKCAAGGSGLDLLNANTVDVARVFLYRDSIRPTDGSVGLRLPASFNGAVYVIRDTAVGSDTAGGFHYGYDVAELADFTGSTFAQNCTTAVYCRGGTWTRFEHLHVAACTTIFSTRGASGGTQINAKVHWEPGGITAAQFCDEDQTLSRPLTGQVEVSLAGDYGEGGSVVKSLPATIDPFGGLPMNLRRSGGSFWSLEQHPRDTFARLIDAPSSTAIPGLTSDTLHGWRIEQGSWSITQQTSNGKLFNADATTGSMAFVPVLHGDRGGRTRTLSVSLTTGGTLANVNHKFHLQRVRGGSNDKKGIQFVAFQDQLFLTVNSVNILSVAGLFAASTTYAIDMTVTVAPDGLPSRVRAYVGGVKKIDYWLTAAQRSVIASGTTWPYLEDGVGTGTDTASYITLFSLKDAADRDDANNVTPTVSLAVSAGATQTPNASAGSWQTLTVSDATAFTIAAPSNPPTSTLSQDLVIEVSNTAGGAMGAITWNAAYVFNGFTWANPANTKKRWARFTWNGSVWVCTGIAGADY